VLFGTLLKVSIQIPNISCQTAVETARKIDIGSKSPIYFLTIQNIFGTIVLIEEKKFFF
jgi:hypothetical protein